MAKVTGAMITDLAKGSHKLSVGVAPAQRDCIAKSAVVRGHIRRSRAESCRSGGRQEQACRDRSRPHETDRSKKKTPSGETFNPDTPFSRAAPPG